MADARREQYSVYQPVFWRPAADARQVHRSYLAQLVDDRSVITWVSEDSAGPTCMIDDFVVVPGRWATTGAALLRAGLQRAHERGAVQAVAMAGHLDQPKREALKASGLGIASEWWVTPLLAATGSSAT